jgi:glycosyltransferase involved in cell wall biosynthesis
MVCSVSVITPVYNGALFIEKAIRSAAIQPEVLEIIVVNDGSTDETEQILDSLMQKTPKLKVVYHKNKINKGRSASRNLGIKQACGNYIAFLDADDYYLADRFKNDKVIFDNNDEVDGVYNAIGVHYYREQLIEEREDLLLTTVTKKIESVKLFNDLLTGKKGYFSIDGLTVKKSIFTTIGYFNDKLEVAEDTDLILKMALKCNLEAGVIDKPLAMRGVHENNIFDQENMYTQYRPKMYKSLLFWSLENRISSTNLDKILEMLWFYRNKQEIHFVKDIIYWMQLIVKKPKLLTTYLGYKYFPIIRQRKKLFPILFR